ncbi:phospholipase carboxylesterase [Phlyctema vagabunda]|uniref:Phospholipase carboxylesterase n=1 Tax=Phlyctema vagabunda TaxID=108571 RepID=A0ABR4PHX2_9HELO
MTRNERIHIVLPTAEHTHTFILLHGRDSVASEFADELFESQASDDRTLRETFPSMRWVFPSAERRTSARFDTDMSQWFDIWSVERPQERKELQGAGLRESIACILDIVREESRTVPLDHIVLGGISQGCATAILALMLGKLKIAGFVGLCSWLPLEDELHLIAMGSAAEKASSHDAVQNLLGEDLAAVQSQKQAMHLATAIPIFLAHSKDDPIVPVGNGDKLARAVADLGFTVTRRVYEDGGHWVYEPEGIDDISAFLRMCLPEAL